MTYGSPVDPTALPEGYDATADVRAMRDEDNRIVEAKWARIEAENAAPQDPAVEAAAGQRLLAALGLDTVAEAD